jgi:predicted nucleic acid-binding protein
MSGVRSFLDTNVFVYLLDRRDLGKSLAANQLLETLIASRTGVCSYQVEQEFFNVAFRKGLHPILAEDAKLTHAGLFAKLDCIPSSSQLLWRGFETMERYRLPWYDSLIVAAALQAECSVLCSEDFQDGQVFEGSLAVVNPFAD